MSPYWVVYWAVIGIVALGSILLAFLRHMCARRYARPPHTASAIRRADQLLYESLKPRELDQMRQTGWLDVPSRFLPGRVYRIPRAGGQTCVFEGGSLVEALCVGSSRWVPNSDLVLMHKLMIEGAEGEYLRKANHFPVRRPNHPYPLMTRSF